MKLKLSSLKVGDVIPVDVGYNGVIDMVDLPIVAISNGRNLWTGEPEKVVEVRWMHDHNAGHVGGRMEHV